MTKDTIVGIDIGTRQIKVIMAEVSGKDKHMPKIIGAGLSESKGLRHGYITNLPEVAKSLEQALSQAEKSSGVKIKKAYVSMGGIGLSSISSTGGVIISRADSQVTEFELEKVLEECEREIPTSSSINKKIINTIPISYKMDNKIVWGNPIGMKGMKLEAKTLFITCLEQHINDLIEAVEEAQVEVVDIVASPIASSLVNLTKTQKIAGCVLADIGGETVSIAVFENNIPISLEVFPVGSNDITNDVALGLKIPLEEAENIKLEGIANSAHSKKKFEEIVDARLDDIFELIENHLKKIGKNGLLPAGIVITGGGSGMIGIEEFAKSSLKLPSKIASLGLKDENKMKDSIWSVAYGLCVLGANSSYNDSTIGADKFRKQTKNKILEWIKQFLP